MSLDVQTLDERVPFINATGLPGQDIEPSVRQVASSLAQWMTMGQTPNRAGSLFQRNTYASPSNPLIQMSMARRAVQEDDVVGGIVDATEGLIFQGTKWESEEADDADVFNQISTALNMDAVMRMAYRELATCSQVVFASWWGVRSFTVRGYNPPPKEAVLNHQLQQQQLNTPPPVPVAGQPAPPQPPPVTPETMLSPPRRGTKRRKKYTAFVPIQLTVLDSTKVIPVGNRLWGGDRLAWHGTAAEIETWEGLYDGTVNMDLTMAQLIIGRYVPDEDEASELSAMGINPDRLLELNPARVWRHTLTKPSYARWADVRLRSVFRLLDLKAQLMEADRVNLVGAANYILLVKKGSKEEPAYQAEIDNLKENFATVAKLPVIVSDHRLEIEIITPKTDYTLDEKKYDTLDKRITSRVLGSMSTGESALKDTYAAKGTMIARLLDSRRHMLKRCMEQYVARAITEANPGTFEDEPNLAFTPRQLQLDSDPQVTQAVMALRQQKEISRDSILEFFGFDQAVEAQRRIWEEDSGLDNVFGTTIPFSSPVNNAGGMPAGAFGSTGGRPSGGGQPTQNGTTKSGSGNS